MLQSTHTSAHVAPSFLSFVKDHFGSHPLPETLEAFRIVLDSIVFDHQSQSMAALEVSKVALFITQLSQLIESEVEVY